MKLKIDEDGHAVVQDGKPVYIESDGKEVAFDAPGTVAAISRLNGEAKHNRESKEAAEKALKAFEGIEDPQEALKAIEAMQNIDRKKLVDAGEVEKVKSEIAKGYEKKLSDAEEKINGLSSTLNREMIGGAFGRSGFIKEKIAVPPDMVEATFGKSFKIEDGRVVAYDKSGSPIYSRSNPSEVAGFDEALEILVDGYQHKDSILIGANGGGGGTRNGGGNGGSRTITRQQFESMKPAEQQKMAAAAREGTVKIND